ncbi:MAG TPA: sulfite exporter TauE/SafE family protein [Ferruginibacter sp.]|nr:sulfite exporter TauE/SafE family protein [Ferruginibacter sp.]HMP21449.1 sulfite exporter TauE/SafE family protein [Ferruginibacter sp.]
MEDKGTGVSLNEEVEATSSNGATDNFDVLSNSTTDDIADLIPSVEAQEKYIEKINDENVRSPYLRWIIIGLGILVAAVAVWLLFIYSATETQGKVANWVYSFFTKSFFLYVFVGLCAQMVDGALGMAYGATATSFLASMGVGPAQSSASIHISEIFTTGASGISHLKLKNVNKKLLWRLVVPGIVGSAIGALLLSVLEKGGYVTEDQFQKYFKPITTLYTLILGVIVVKKAFGKKNSKKKIRRITPLALAGSFFDAVGGGGWGPIVTSTLLGRGRSVNYTIGSVNAAEFFVALTSSVIFAIFLGLEPGLWQVIVGLIVGGVFAAPFAAYIVHKVRKKPLMIFVGVFIILLSLNTFAKLTIKFDIFRVIADWVIG